MGTLRYICVVHTLETIWLVRSAEKPIWNKEHRGSRYWNLFSLVQGSEILFILDASEELMRIMGKREEVAALLKYKQSTDV